MQLKELYQIYLAGSGISTDTRKIESGQLFIALKGGNFNGNQFAQQAIEKGAAYVLVDDPDVVEDDRYILTDDTLVTLQDLANYHRGQLNIPVFGLTGSNGKTTTKELLHAALSYKYNVTATKGNFNNHIGVPLTILQASKDTEFLLVEMGANQPGDIDLLCQIAMPDYGLITNIGAAHLELLKDLNGVLAEKSQLFKHVVNRQGTFFLNTGDSFLSTLGKPGEKIIGYTKQKGLFGTLSLKDDSGEFGVTYQIVTGEENIEFHSHLSGNYNQENIAAAMHVALHFGVSLKDSIKAIRTYSPDNMRSESRKTKRNTIILDAYNANPTSMRLSIETFQNANKHTPLKCVLILGDMLELGAERLKFHQEIIDLLEEYPSSEVFLVGKLFSACKNGDYKAYKDVQELQETRLLENLNGRVILIKGSRGIRLETLLPSL